VRAGLDVRNDEGVIDVAALSRVLDEADAPA
jgi:hypothetical protein